MRTASWIPALLAINLCLSAQTQPGAPVRPPTLRDAHLPAQLQKEILAEILSNTADGEHNADQLQQIALDSTVRIVQPKPRGPAAILVEGAEGSPLCAWTGNGNCLSWIFVSTGDRTDPIFLESVQGIAVEKTTHHGMPNLSTAERDGHTVRDNFEVYQFDGKTYNPAYCYESDVDKNGRYVETPHHACSGS